MTNKEKITDYKLVLETAGNIYKSRGKTIDGCLADLSLSWEQIKYKGIVKITKNGQTYGHLFYQPQLRRIFANKTTRLLWAKRLDLLLRENKDKEAYRK